VGPRGASDQRMISQALPAHHSRRDLPWLRPSQVTRQNATADQLDESRLPAGVEKTQTWYATESPNTVHGQLHQALATR